MYPADVFFRVPSSTVTYTLSLHDALPIYPSNLAPSATTISAMHALIASRSRSSRGRNTRPAPYVPACGNWNGTTLRKNRDRKSTRLNSSHVEISYAVFCLKKKNQDLEAEG